MATTPKKPAAKASRKAPRKEPVKTTLATIKTAVKEAKEEKPATPVEAAPAPIAQKTETPRVYEKKVDKFGRSYATGKRKNAVARVWIKPGKGQVTVNGRDVKVYFARPVLQMVVNQPFDVANRTNQFDVECLVTGGGLSGQAGAVKHGIAKALTLFEPDLRKPLKVAKFLRRDARVVERKKYGRVKARRRFQYSKR